MSKEANEELWKAALEIDRSIRLADTYLLRAKVGNTEFSILETKIRNLFQLLDGKRYELSIEVYDLFRTSLSQLDLDRNGMGVIATGDARSSNIKKISSFRNYLHIIREKINEENRAEQISSEVNSIPSNLSGNERLVALLRRRLLLLQEKQAIYGISSDPSIIIEIQDIEAQIKKLSK